MTTRSGLGDKPPPCDSSKDGGSLIGERLSRLPPKLGSTFHLIYKLEARGWVRHPRALEHRVSLERQPALFKPHKSPKNLRGLLAPRPSR